VASAISCDNLGKQYRLGRTVGGYGRLTESLSGILSRRRTKVPGATIWALRGVSFAVPGGQAVGVIGRNGAGKSTLLKILSRITTPTEGRAVIRGRVGSLLEVGTGFHPELTGRENIMLNGAILGMRRREITRRFDEIVDFAGVSTFLDTPVKRFSSGMYVRLAFAVAAHLDPDVLLIDEVLAVGDAEFQQRCLSRMAEVAGEGRTVIFVSHDLGAVTRLCTRGIWIDGGTVKFDGGAADAAARYLSSGAKSSNSWRAPDDDDHDGAIVIEGVEVRPTAGHDAVGFAAPFEIEATYRVETPIRNAVVTVRLSDALGNVILTSWDGDSVDVTNRAVGRYRSTCEVPASILRPGRYWLSLGSFVPGAEDIDLRSNVLAFDIGAMGYPLNSSRVGVITPVLRWSTDAI